THVVVLTPRAYFSFDNPGATVTNHVSGQAVATGDAPESIVGKKGNAALFNGSNHYTQEAYDAIQLGARDFTIEMWMKSADDAAYIFHKGSHAANATTGATGHWVGLELKNAVLYFAIDDDVTKSQTYFKEADKYFDNEWHHVVLVRDTYAKQLLIYMDGELKGSAADNTGAINDNNELLVLGNVGVSYDNNFNGALDEFTIYEGAMSAEKVAERYATTGKELAYFPFDTVGETTPNLTFGEATATNGTPAAVEGIKGGAVSFADGAHYKQEAYDAIQMGENDFTITCWIKSTDADGYLYFKGSHAANASTGTTGHWIGLERHSSGALTFAIDDNVNKSDTKLADANYVFDGRWHHIACVRNFADKTNTLYVDGVE
ncbi:MAG: LamG domain-containing protein, partial [Duncaniella sp.]|nr:LamG domain-containing protein [Duncaniella sp.]